MTDSPQPPDAAGRFQFRAEVRPDWIDYNGHMQDAFYGLIFSYAVDAFQDAVGFDAAYRARTGCTIYLLEDHKRFLKEVHPGATVHVETILLDFDEKRFHLWSEMYDGTALVAVSEMMELHVQRAPTPRAAPIPAKILARLKLARQPASENVRQLGSRVIRLS
jgi:acyl-CoA thioester hydrolase